jgi:hypothetical protein
VLIWGGNTWHGAVPRRTPGLRVVLLVFFSRWYLYKGEQDPAARVTPGMLARNPPPFRRLSGVDPVSLIPPTCDAPTGPCRAQPLRMNLAMLDAPAAPFIAIFTTVVKPPRRRDSLDGMERAMRDRRKRQES